MSDSDIQKRESQLRVLVTGAGSGVGEETAKLFASRGARVALVGRRQEQLDRVRRDIGANAIAIPADVSGESSARQAARSAIDAFAGLDIVVNAAGVAGFSMLEDMPDGRWDQVIGTNLSGTFYVSHEVSLRMREDAGGVIINVASDLATMGAAGLVAYCASKAGVVGLTRAMAIELAPSVRVNAVCPGPIDTPMLRDGLSQEIDPERALLDKIGSVPLRRLCDPAEVAKAIWYLAIEGTFATGACLALDGGTSAA